MIGLFNSCTSDEVDIQKNQEEFIDFVDTKIVKTSDDFKKANTILEVTRVLRKIYRDPQVVEEVNAAIATGYYEDEIVLLKDLLNPTTSLLYKLQSFKDRSLERGFKLGYFKTRFEEELGILKSPNVRTSDLYFEDNGVSIYFPYSQNTQYSTYPITVVAGTVESDQANAQHPLCDDLNSTTYAYCSQTVTVNDNYAAQNPTHIIGNGGAVIQNSTSSTSCNGAFNLHYGYIKFWTGHQYDKLISFTGNGGGSEMNFFVARTNHRNVTTTSETNMGLDLTVYVTRKRIRDQNWVPIWTSVFFGTGSLWPSHNTNLAFCVFEEDSGNVPTRYFTGTLTSMDANGSFSNIYSIGAKSNDRIISNNVRDRVWFLNQHNSLGGTPPFIQGYEPQFSSDDNKIVITYPISCVQ